MCGHVANKTILVNQVNVYGYTDVKQALYAFTSAQRFKLPIAVASLSASTFSIY